ncbi:MAG: hypothetical protein JWO06_1181 [Bacteroidota bacterium]|nr:hypothetical protein [Bacteroidota bacterium]
MTKNYTITQFRKEYSNDDVCLDKIFRLKFDGLKNCPSCKQPVMFKRVTKRTCYYCPRCYHQIHPLKNTIFEKTTTPLTLWFYAMYLFAASKNGVSAKEIERQIGVTYKTAFRMLHKIRSLLENDLELLDGIIELDETFVGGKNKNRHRDKKVQGCQGRSFKDKTPVFGMLQRDGKVKAFVVPNTNTESLMPHAFSHIAENATVCTDEWYAYEPLRHKYTHEQIQHNKGEYANGNITTNRVENYWSNVKRTLNGTYITVSKKYLQNYVNEVSFKFNHRKDKNLFDILINKV